METRRRMFNFGDAMGARALNAGLGLWLLYSAFLWPAMPGLQRSTAVIVGLLVVATALAGLWGMASARYWNVVLGGWLILSVIVPAWPGRVTFWNHIATGFGLVLFGLVARVRDLRGRRDLRTEA